MPPGDLASHELIRQLSSISREINRQVAVLITRKGKVSYVVVGSKNRIVIPDLSGFREGAGRLKGLRCIHSHLNGESLTKEDLSDLILLRLDLMACFQVDEKGLPGPIEYANILPTNKHGQGWIVNRVPDIGRLNLDFLEMIQSLEEELTWIRPSLSTEKKERALLVGIRKSPHWQEESSLDELNALAASDDIEVIGKVTQKIKRPDPRFLIGKGKLGDLVLRCLQTGSNLLIFDDELTPAQVKALSDFTDLKIIDRSQLILDIFARRAITREGKLQVELAQLKYLLPRLASKNTAMSRLTGGIGGRGPGETKLEIDRRRVRERIARLSRKLQEISRQRERRRRPRQVKGLPIISIIGYTNAGKSTLLNALTYSKVTAKDRLFETLDPSSRRLRFPHEREAIITDTVGFIRDLPEDIMKAFAATLEELKDADLLIHVVDAASPRMEEEIKAVECMLKRLDLHMLPMITALNKTDLLNPPELEALKKRMDVVAISAIDPSTLTRLVSKIEDILWPFSFHPKTENSPRPHSVQGVHFT